MNELNEETLKPSKPKYFIKRNTVPTLHMSICTTTTGIILWSPGARHLEYHDKNLQQRLLLNISESLIYVSTYKNKICVTTHNHIYLYKKKFKLILRIRDLEKHGKIIATFVFHKYLILDTGNTIVVMYNNRVLFNYSYTNMKITNEHLILIYNGTVIVINRTMKIVYDNKIDDTIIDAFIYKRKVYLLTNTNLIGHDLNIILSKNAKYESFYMYKEYILLRSENELLAIDRNNIFLFRRDITKTPKNTKVFNYAIDENIIYYLFKNKLVFYEFSYELYVKYRLISENVVYEEKEDEFDKSDGDYTDI